MCKEFNDAEIPKSPININGVDIDKMLRSDNSKYFMSYKSN